jgi:hypothetical protein
MLVGTDSNPITSDSFKAMVGSMFNKLEAGQYNLEEYNFIEKNGKHIPPNIFNNSNVYFDFYTSDNFKEQTELRQNIANLTEQI